MEGLDRLDRLDGLDGLDGLDRLDGLDGLDGLDRLDRLDRLDGLDGLDRLDGLDKLVKPAAPAHPTSIVLALLPKLGFEVGNALVGGFELMLQPFCLFALVGAVAQAGSGHALLDSSLLDKSFFQLFLVGSHHTVYHVAEGESYVGHIFISPALEVSLILLQTIIMTAKAEHTVVTFMAGVPTLKMP